jgi:hypothetical protein
MFMLGALHCVYCLSCSREGSSFDVLVNGQPALNLACSDFLGLGSDPNVQVRGWKQQHSHHSCSRSASAAALNVACSDSLGLGSNPNVQVRVTSAGSCVWESNIGSRVKLQHLLNTPGSRSSCSTLVQCRQLSALQIMHPSAAAAFGRTCCMYSEM